MRNIEDWLTQQGLEEYSAVFVEQAITVKVLPDLTDQDVDRLGLPIGPRRELLVAIEAMRAARAHQAMVPANSLVPHPNSAHEAERRHLR